MKTKIKNGITAAAISAGLLTGASLAIAQPAVAASGDPGYINAPAEIRKGPSYFYGVSSYVNYSGWNYFGCWTDDGQGHRWFSLYLGNQQWVDTRFITSQPSLPHC
jgi:hypothetical protein